MLMRLNETIRRHLSDNIISYAIVLFFFILGISMGALTVSNINIDMRSDVKSYIDGFINITRTESIHPVEILKQSIKLNLITALVLSLAGLTYAGILLVPIISTFRGFCIGFTVAFLTDALGRGGFLLSLVSILPQSLVYIPVIVVFSVCSISFSFAILKAKLNRKRSEISSYMVSYALTSLVLFLIMIAGSIIESYMTPLLVKLVAQYLM